MIVQIDTREKARAIKKILAEFDQQDVKYINSKMYVGDYCNRNNPNLIIDRKQNIAEIAANATKDHDRVKRELLRLDNLGPDAKMIFLIEQSKIGNKPIKELSDIMTWENPRGTVNGMQVFRILSAWEAKHNIEFQFCSKNQTGKRIIKILEEGD